MPAGAGKYDDLCTYVRKQALAVGAIVIVVDGKQGSGFSVQGPVELQADLPTILQVVADEIKASLLRSGQ